MCVWPGGTSAFLKIIKSSEKKVFSELSFPPPHHHFESQVIPTFKVASAVTGAPQFINRVVKEKE